MSGTASNVHLVCPSRGVGGHRHKRIVRVAFARIIAPRRGERARVAVVLRTIGSRIQGAANRQWIAHLHVPAHR